MPHVLNTFVYQARNFHWFWDRCSVFRYQCSNFSRYHHKVLATIGNDVRLDRHSKEEGVDNKPELRSALRYILQVSSPSARNKMLSKPSFRMPESHYGHQWSNAQFQGPYRTSKCWCSFGLASRCYTFSSRKYLPASRWWIAPWRRCESGETRFWSRIAELVDVVPRGLAGRLVIGIWIGQSWPQQDYVTTILFYIRPLTHGPHMHALVSEPHVKRSGMTAVKLGLRLILNIHDLRLAKL